MANYNVEYNIVVKADDAAKQLKGFADAVNSLVGATGKDPGQTSKLTRNLNALSRAMQGLISGAGALGNAKSLKNKCDAIKSFGDALGTAFTGISKVTFNANLTKSINSFSQAVGTLSAIKLPDQAFANSLKDFARDILPAFSTVANRFSEFKPENAKKMVSAANYVKNAANVIGQISASGASIKKAKQAVGSLREFTDTMTKYNAMMASASGDGTTIKKNPLRSFASSVNSVIKAVNTISDSGMSAKFKELDGIMKKFGGLAGNGGVMEIMVDTSTAEANLQILINQAIELRSVLASCKTPNVPVTGFKNYTKNTDDRKGGGGGDPNNPNARGGLTVYGGGSRFYQSSSPRSGAPFQVYGAASRGGAGGSGGSSGGSGSTGTSTGTSVWRPKPVQGLKPDNLYKPDFVSWYRSMHAANPTQLATVPLSATEQAWANTLYRHGPARRFAHSRFPQFNKIVQGAVDGFHVDMRGRTFIPGYKVLKNSIIDGRMGPSLAPGTIPSLSSIPLPTQNQVGAYMWSHSVFGERPGLIGGASGSTYDFSNVSPQAYQRAVQQLLAQSTAIIRSHEAFNRQLAANYQTAIAEAHAAASAVGSGGANPFNKIGDNSSVNYALPPQAKMRRHRTLNTSALRGDGVLPKIGRNAARAYARSWVSDPLAGAVDPVTGQPYFHFKSHWKGGGTARQNAVGWANSSLSPENLRAYRLSVYGNQLEALRANKNAATFASMQANRGQWRVGTRPLSGGRYMGLIPKNIGYKVLGPSMLDGGGLGIGSMLKGMGVMYGIMGAGQLATKTFQDYVDYNNIMQTTMNILGAHDKSAGFFDDFASMAHTVRRVGVETKFTAPEVADAAKFLAMAGLSSQDIKDAIRPIADIALVGDTDLGSTADVVTNIMTAYGIKGSGMRRAADIMTNTFTMSNTTLPEMAQSYKYAAGLLAANGISFQESAAAFGVLGNAGVKGSQAGTTMRTIIANLRNPTSRQATAWAGIKYKDENGKLVGVNTKDENGKLRSLVDIFGDLAKADKQNRAAGGAGIDMYKLFHKTAAQGATALLSQVDKWNEIINENFMSDGMVAKLAEAKKNTISGLWAQLTSMFTEDGIRSFSKLDTGIRGLLSGAIDSLDPSKNPSIQGMMDKGVNVIVDLLDTVKGVTGGLYTTFTHFGGFITSFMKIQMMLMPVLMMLRGLRSVQNLALGGIAMTRSVGNFFGGNGALAASIPGIWKRRNNHIFGNGRYTLGEVLGSRFGAQQKDSLRTGRYNIARYNRMDRILSTPGFAQAHPKMFNSIFNEYAALDQTLMSQKNPNGRGVVRGQAANNIRNLRLLAMKRQAIMPVTTGIGSIAGMVGGGILGSNIATSLGAEEGDGWQMAGAMLGGAAGMAGMGKLGSLLGSAIATGPVGWIAGGAILATTLGILTYKFFKLKAASDAFVNSTKWSSGLDSDGNMLLHDSLTDMQKRLMILNNEQLTLNEKKEKYLELLRQEKDLAKDDEGATVQDVAPKLAAYLENSKDTMNSWWNYGDKWEVAKRTADKMGVENMFDIEILDNLKDGGGALKLYNPFNPEQSETIHGLNNVYRENIANTMYNYGASWSKGTPFYDIYEKWQKSIYAVTSAEELSRVLQGIQAEAATYYNSIDWSKANETDIDTILKSNPRNNPYAVFGLLQSAFDITNNPNNLWRKQGQSILNLLPKLGGEKFPAQEAMAFLNLMGAAGTTQDGGYTDLYSEKFDGYMDLKGARWASDKAQKDAESLLKTMMASIGVLHTSYRNAMRSWVMGSHFAQMAGNGYVPDDAPDRTTGVWLQDSTGARYQYQYDDSGFMPLWKLAPGQGSPKDLPKAMGVKEFDQYRRTNGISQSNDTYYTVPEDEEQSYDQTSFQSNYAPTETANGGFGAGVNISSINVPVNIGGDKDPALIASLLESALKEKVPEIIIGALNPIV